MLDGLLLSIYEQLLRESDGPDDEQVFVHPFDPRLTVVILYPTSPQYTAASKLFRSHMTHAFLLFDKRLVALDGAVVEQDWFTTDHFDVIMAHELAHFLLKHRERSRNNERQADWLGIKLLLGNDRRTAADLLVKLYKKRYRRSWAESKPVVVP